MLVKQDSVLKIPQMMLKMHNLKKKNDPVFLNQESMEKIIWLFISKTANLSYLSFLTMNWFWTNAELLTKVIIRLDGF